jgi:hypothetical protein
MSGPGGRRVDPPLSVPPSLYFLSDLPRSPLFNIHKDSFIPPEYLMCIRGISILVEQIKGRNHKNTTFFLFWDPYSYYRTTTIGINTEGSLFKSLFISSKAHGQNIP